MQSAAGKKWQPYLVRGEELQSRYPLVAYYCRLYVVESLMKVRNAPGYDSALDLVMLDTLDKCERVKSVIQDQLQDGEVKMEEFCLGIFANADKADRESPSQPPDVTLAGRFYISSLFFDVLTQFHLGGILPPDLEEKRKYAKYRTIQIRNRKPIDPQPDVTNVTATGANQKSVSSGSVQAKATSSGFQYRDEDGNESPKPQAPAKKAAPAPRAVQAPPQLAEIADEPSSPTSGVSRGDALAAKKKLQMAISAIDFADYNSAKTLCGEAAKLLTPQ